MGSLPNLHELCSKDDEQVVHGTNKYCIPGHAGHNDKCKFNRGHQKVFKSRSNGNSGHIYDDMILEHMQAYSPVSSRSTRNLTQHNVIRRRDSMNSSIGATSVRRLITVVRNTHSRYGPVYDKQLLMKNLMIICVSHFVFSLGFFPFLALQSSVSIWNEPIENSSFIPTNINAGSLLLSTLYLFAAISALLGPSLVHKLGTNWVIFIFYLVAILFFACHFYPILYLLVPVYVLFGLSFGPVCISKITLLMNLSTKLSYQSNDDDEDQKHLRKTCVIRRVARFFQASQDIGLIVGSLMTAILIFLTFNNKNIYTALDNKDNLTVTPKINQTLYIDNQKCGECCNCVPCNCSLTCLETNEVQQRCCKNETCRYDPKQQRTETISLFDYNTFMDNIFDFDEQGDRLCGSNACPSNFGYNSSEHSILRVLPKYSADLVIGFYIVMSCFALAVASFGLDKIRLVVNQDPLERPEGVAALKAVKESFKDFRLQLAAPLAVFIGMEQAFMYSDFTKSYVVCTLGIDKVNMAFFCMGLLQSIAACTLSMLLRTIQRCIVIAVGVVFQACLLMVLFLWKPSSDDPALFYVISAAWGVCNAIWEMLNFTLLTGVYSESNWEAAFTNSIFFRHIGLALMFSFHGLLCNWLKLYLLAAVMVSATIPFAWLEIKLENIRRVKNISRL